MKSVTQQYTYGSGCHRKKMVAMVCGEAVAGCDGALCFGDLLLRAPETLDIGTATP